MSTTATEAAQVEPLRLFILPKQKDDQPIEPGGDIPPQLDSVVDLAWCISRETAKMLQDQKVVDPKLLIVVSNDQEEMSRELVPLKRGHKFIQFYRPGVNTIHATVVWQKANEGDAESILKKRDDHGHFVARVVESYQPEVEELDRQIDELEQKLYGYRTTEEEQEQLQEQHDQLCARRYEVRERAETYFGIRLFDAVERLGFEAQWDVAVSAGLFGKSSWVIRKLGAIYPWESKPRDQCHLRRRALWTVATLPVSAAVMAVVTGLVEMFQLATTSWLLLRGKRSINFEPLLKPWPFGTDPDDIWWHTGPSVWLKRKSKEERGVYENQPWYFVPLSPLLWLPVGIGSFFLADYWDKIPATAKWVALWIIVGIIALVCVLFVIDEIDQRRKQTARERDAIKRQQEAAKRQREAEERRLAQERTVQELAQIACDNGDTVVTRARIAQRRSSVLSYERTKAKLCRPFAK